MPNSPIVWPFSLIAVFSVATCEDVAYVFDESGGHVLENCTILEYNGSAVLNFTVASDPNQRGATGTSNMTADMVRTEFDKRIEADIAKVNRKTTLLAARHPGVEISIEQVCEIYEYLRGNWTLTPDPRGVDLYRYPNETLEDGNVGDCDDFALLMAAMIESIGGTTKIVMAHGPNIVGHAYTMVYLGRLGTPDEVEWTINWLQSKYNVPEISTDKDLSTDRIWLNLDWSADYPGGPRYPATNHMPLLIRSKYEPVALKPPNKPPLAVISYEQKGWVVGDVIALDASKSKDPEGGKLEYRWVVGGEQYVERSITYPLSQKGALTINLTVTDDKDASTSNSTVIKINDPPVADFFYEPPQSKVGEVITFDASDSHDPDGRKQDLIYSWDFGDGNTSEGQVVDNIYSSGGPKTVRLEVRDGDNATASTSKVVEVNHPPQAVISYYPTDPKVKEVIIFNGSLSRDEDGDKLTYKWNMGDGTPKEGDVVEHSYQRDNLYGEPDSSRR